MLEFGVSGLGVRDCCLIRGGGERVEVARTKRLVESARVVSTEERLGGSLDLVRLTGRSDELVWMLMVEAPEEGGVIEADSGGRDEGGLIVERVGLPTGE